MKKELIADSCLALLLLLFSYTAISKLLDYHRFVFQMKLAPLPFMKMMAPFLGWLLPMMEGLLVLALFFTRYRLKGLYAAVALLLVFEIYITGMLLSGLDLPCTCGGIISKLSWKQHLVFNALFIIISIIPLVILEKQKPGIHSGKFKLKNIPRA
jgi:putative oxidoreductase